MSERTHDLLVVGGGPAGAATAYWAATNGLDTIVVERKAFPREKTCGDGLTPRAFQPLAEMGRGSALQGMAYARSVASGRVEGWESGRLGEWEVVEGW